MKQPKKCIEIINCSPKNMLVIQTVPFCIWKGPGMKEKWSERAPAQKIRSSTAQHLPDLPRVLQTTGSAQPTVPNKEQQYRREIQKTVPGRRDVCVHMWMWLGIISCISWLRGRLDSYLYCAYLLSGCIVN